jgi:hypothetical protein
MAVRGQAQWGGMRHVMAWQAGPVLARFVRARQGRNGSAGHCLAGQGLAWPACLGRAWLCAARSGAAGLAGLGSSRQVRVRQARRATAWLCQVRLGRQAWLGGLWRSAASNGVVRWGRHVMVR